jgi:hypothetical protein
VRSCVGEQLVAHTVSRFVQRPSGERGNDLPLHRARRERIGSSVGSRGMNSCADRESQKPFRSVIR